MSPWHLRQTVHCLGSGGLIAYPTETVYGLGCNPLDYEAVEALLSLKQRPMNKGLILIASNIEQLLPFIDNSNKAALKKLQSKTKTPITWLMPAREQTPNWLTGDHDTIAVRITRHPLAMQLCQAFGGAIVSTSANLTGQPPADNALKVRRYFGDNLNYILSGLCGPSSRPSEIRDACSNIIIRA